MRTANVLSSQEMSRTRGVGGALGIPEMVPASPRAAFFFPQLTLFTTGEASQCCGEVLLGWEVVLLAVTQIPGHFCSPCPDFEDVTAAPGQEMGLGHICHTRAGLWMLPVREKKKCTEICCEAAGIASGSRRLG